MYHPLSHRYFQQHHQPCLQARATPLAPHQWKQMLASAQHIPPSHLKSADAASDPPGTSNKRPETSNARLVASNRRPDSDAQSSGELHELQTSAAAARPDVVVLDVRNDYEWDAGHFQGADRPQEVCNFSHAGHSQCVSCLGLDCDAFSATFVTLTMYSVCCLSLDFDAFFANAFLATSPWLECCSFAPHSQACRWSADLMGVLCVQSIVTSKSAAGHSTFATHMHSSFNWLILHHVHHDHAGLLKHFFTLLLCK